jgi:hypothetical protein
LPQPLTTLHRRVGGVVTQRIANPCTPVRFRYSPPFKINGLHDVQAQCAGESKQSSKHSVFVLFALT